MQILGQATEVAEEAVRVVDAAAEHGYEAALLALIVVSGLTFVGWLLRQIVLRRLAVEERTMNEAKFREDRLATRVSSLEDLIRGELISRAFAASARGSSRLSST